MTNKAFQDLLKQYPDDMPVKLLIDHKRVNAITDMDEENLLLTSETVYITKDAPEDEWDTEDGKRELGNGQQFLLINPIIL